MRSCWQLELDSTLLQIDILLVLGAMALNLQADRSFNLWLYPVLVGPWPTY